MNGRRVAVAAGLDRLARLAFALLIVVMPFRGRIDLFRIRRRAFRRRWPTSSSTGSTGWSS